MPQPPAALAIMPKPPDVREKLPTGDVEPSGLMRDLLLQVSEERSAAAERHKDVLAKFVAQQDIFERLLSNGLSQDAASLGVVPAVNTDALEPKLEEEKGRESLVTFAEEPEYAPDLSQIAPKEANLLSRKSQLQFGKKVTETITFRHKARNFVENDRFEMGVACLIMANAFVMCFEVQQAGLQVGCRLRYVESQYCGSEDNIWPGAEQAFEILDWLFGVVFTLEALLKILIEGWRYLLSGWNCLDFVCVLVFVVDKAASALLVMDSQAMRMLRLFRLVRLIKLLRSLESLDALYLMTTALKGMMLVVVWAMTLLVIMLATCDLFLTQFLHSTYFSDLTADTATDSDKLMYTYYGTTTRCFLTMFELTLANWTPAARLLVENVSEAFTPICLLHKLTFGFAVVGVINGVILQETFKVASTDDFIMMRHTKREQDALRNKLKVLYTALDKSEDGEVDYEEFRVISAHPDVMHWLTSMGIETDDLKTLFELVDVDANGTISLEELVEQMPRIRGQARNFEVMALRKESKNAWAASGAS